MGTPLPSPLASTPYASVLTNILNHQKERKTADDQAARQLKDKMIVEYRNQSEQHEILTTEFVGRLQDGLDELVATLVTQIPNRDADTDDCQVPAVLHETINSYILEHLGVYQKEVKKCKLNSRQRTDRFSGKAFTRYTQTLERDEKDLWALYKKLEGVYEEAFPSTCSDPALMSVEKAMDPQTLVADSIKLESE